jgi:hypothetical protein
LDPEIIWERLHDDFVLACELSVGAGLQNLWREHHVDARLIGFGCCSGQRAAQALAQTQANGCHLEATQTSPEVCGQHTSQHGQPHQDQHFLERALPKSGCILQKDATVFLPPGGRVWQNRTSGAWHARVPPLKEVSRSWARHGEAESLFLVIREAWKQYCTLQGLDAQDCPMDGVFEALTVAAADPSSSSHGR